MEAIPSNDERNCSAADIRTHGKRSCREFAQISEKRKYGSRRRDNGAILAKKTLRPDLMATKFGRETKFMF